jgi:hypothetical protein
MRKRHRPFVSFVEGHKTRPTTVARSDDRATTRGDLTLLCSARLQPRPHDVHHRLEVAICVR